MRFSVTAGLRIEPAIVPPQGNSFGRFVPFDTLRTLRVGDRNEYGIIRH